MSQLFYKGFLRLPLIVRLLMISALIMILFGTVVHWIEPENYPSIFDGIWWAIVTASTVGFGDYTPKTIPGRISGILLILFGVSFLTFYFAHLATAAVAKQNEFLEGKSIFKGEGHLVIVGWNERTRKMLGVLKKKYPTKHIILIDETLERLPVHETNLHFVRGKANLDKTLIQANLAGAECVIITADPSKEELDSDMNTILTLLAIKGLEPTIKCIAEVLTSDQVLNARRAGADFVVRTNNLLSTVLINRMESPLSEKAFNELIYFKQNWLAFNEVSEEFVGKRFSEVSGLFSAKKEILIGVIRGEDSYVNPPHEFILERTDLLLVINKSLKI